MDSDKENALMNKCWNLTEKDCGDFTDTSDMAAKSNYSRHGKSNMNKGNKTIDVKEGALADGCKHSNNINRGNKIPRFQLGNPSLVVKELLTRCGNKETESITLCAKQRCLLFALEAEIEVFNKLESFIFSGDFESFWGNSKMMDYERFKEFVRNMRDFEAPKVLTQFLSSNKSLFQKALLVSAGENSDVSLEVNTEILRKICCKFVIQKKYSVVLTKYAMEGTMLLSSLQLENFVCDTLISQFPEIMTSTEDNGLAGEEAQQLFPYYNAICSGMFSFFLLGANDGVNSPPKAVSVVDVLNSNIFQQFVDALNFYKYKAGFRERQTTRFMMDNALQIYDLFLNLDVDGDGLLSKEEFKTFDNGSFVTSFIDGLFSMYNSKFLDFAKFCDLVFAFENKNHESSKKFYFKVLDVHRLGFISRSRISDIVAELLQKLVDQGLVSDTDQTISNKSAVVDEMFDMIHGQGTNNFNKKKDLERLTFKTISKCKVGGDVLCMLCNVQDFWNHETRGPS